MLETLIIKPIIDHVWLLHKAYWREITSNYYTKNEQIEWKWALRMGIERAYFSIRKDFRHLDWYLILRLRTLFTLRPNLLYFKRLFTPPNKHKWLENLLKVIYLFKLMYKYNEYSNGARGYVKSYVMNKTCWHSSWHRRAGYGWGIL